MVSSCILGCSEGATGPSTSSVIMPLAVGNEWIYKTTSYHYNPTRIDTYFDTVKIVRSYVAKGDTVFEFSGTNQYSLYAYQAGTNRNDGYYTEASKGMKIFVKYPVLEGDVFRRDTSYSIPTGGTINTKEYTYTKYMCKQASTFATVPAGIFLCNIYQYYTSGTYRWNIGDPSTYVKDMTESWYSPGLGEVMNLRYWGSDSLVLYLKRELISYHLN